MLATDRAAVPGPDPTSEPAPVPSANGTAQEAAAAITQACATWLRRRDDGGAAQNQDVRIQVRRFIAGELGTPKRAPALIAARLGLSRATLYRVFAPDGIVTSIRVGRVMCAMRRLIRDGARSMRVSQVADAVGVSDGRTFRGAFKGRFGSIPSAASQHPEPVLRRWIEGL